MLNQNITQLQPKYNVLKSFVFAVKCYNDS